ncbi:MAG: L-serine ammonia-lyase [Ramlibacter sp.]
MAISVFDLFKVGIGPSSSHTVGPMKAARMFLDRLAGSGLAHRVSRVQVQLYGSLGATGKGHGSDVAVMLGLAGYDPETVDPDDVPAIIAGIRGSGRMVLGGYRDVAFDPRTDILFLRNDTLPRHANGMRFRAFVPPLEEACCATYYSWGGGFVSGDEDPDATRAPTTGRDGTAALPFASAAGLLLHAERLGMSIAQVMRANERCWRTDEAIDAGLLRIWQVMQDCVARGCRAEGELPGPFHVKRRAAAWRRKLAGRSVLDALDVMDRVNLYALAVNEENAAGGRVVTAPTNGAAGIIPAVLHYYRCHTAGSSDAGVVDFLLTAGAIGILYKEQASLSGAEVGCQGEVGVACSMAAGALCAVQGGSPQQVENAAEIGMEHHLGLTCDPVGGLVQIPCIERNAIASIKAINAARMALNGDGTHHVSLDKVIKTMKETGADMLTKYKETARGGLAVNVVEC